MNFVTSLTFRYKTETIARKNINNKIFSGLRFINIGYKNHRIRQ